MIILDKLTKNIEFLISKGAQMNAKDNDDVSALKTIVSKAPVAMEEYEKKLDTGITLSTDETKIELDFSKIYDKNKLQPFVDEMSMFQDLSKSPFKDYIEHPLCQTFLHDQFNRVKYFFYGGVLVPHLIFSGNFYFLLFLIAVIISIFSDIQYILCVSVWRFMCCWAWKR